MNSPVKSPFPFHREHKFLTHLTLKRPEATVSDSEFICRFAKFLLNSHTATEIQKIILLQKALCSADYSQPVLKVPTGKQIM